MRKRLIGVAWFVFFTLMLCLVVYTVLDSNSLPWQCAGVVFTAIAATGLWISGNELFRKSVFIIWLVALSISTSAAGKELEMEVNSKAMTEVRLNQMLYPTVRMRAKNAGGSGTVIFSGKDASGKWQTYVIGCFHVVDDCIKVEDEYSSMHGRKVKREHRSTVHVEPFRYVDGSRCVGGAASIESDIVAYDENQDIALLRMRDNARPFEFVANIIPKESVSDIQLSNEIWAVGAALGHKPIMTQGHISSIDDEIEDLKYVLSSANTIFGHSGGALFRYSPERKRYEFCGIPARITVMPQGFFSFDTVTWMGFGITVERVYAFLKEWCYDFIYNPDKTIEQCEKERAAKMAEYKRQLDRMYGVVEDKK